jgi:DNA-binding transcriptional regulator YdaS (Cro superfamily)
MKNFNHLLIYFGSTKRIAYALNVNPSTVYLWKRTDKVPIRYLKKIEDLTEGKVNTFNLRPDLLPNFNNPKMYLNPINQTEQEEN